MSVMGENLYVAPRCPAGYVPILMVQAVCGAEEGLEPALTDARWRHVDLRDDATKALHDFGLGAVDVDDSEAVIASDADAVALDAATIGE